MPSPLAQEPGRDVAYKGPRPRDGITEQGSLGRQAPLWTQTAASLPFRSCLFPIVQRNFPFIEQWEFDLQLFDFSLYYPRKSSIAGRKRGKFPLVSQFIWEFGAETGS